jgi:hypothetical protein
MFRKIVFLAAFFVIMARFMYRRRMSNAYLGVQMVYPKEPVELFVRDSAQNVKKYYSAAKIFVFFISNLFEKALPNENCTASYLIV